MNKDTSKKPASSVHAEPADIDEAIRRRAYELYEARGREDGRDLEDWFRAEAEMVQKKSSTIA